MKATPRPPAVSGFCPMGCGQTLGLGATGRITCFYLSCPRPGAVAELVQDPETEHVVVLRPSDFTVKHPLRERLDDQLLGCRIHARIAGGDGPPARPGTYRVVDRDHRLVWLAVRGG